MQGVQKRRANQLAFLLLLLVVFPVLSWYYLRGGLQYRQDVKDALAPKATWPEHALSSIDSLPNLTVWYYGPDGSIADRVAPMMKIYDDRSEEVRFLSWHGELDTAIDSLRKVWLMSGSGPTMHAGVFLMDGEGRILQAYDGMADAAMARLTRDVAVLLPVEKDRKIIFRRERER